MSVAVLRQPVALDPLRVAANCADRPGTLLLHTQRNWNGSGLSALLIDPRWTVHLRAGSRPRWEGNPPEPRPSLVDPLRAPLDWTRSWDQGARPPAEGPIFAGLAGILSYDLGASALGTSHPQPPPFHCDDLWLGAWDCALVFGPGHAPELIVADLAPLMPPGPSLHERMDHMLATFQALEGSEHEESPVQSFSAVERHVDRDWHRAAVHRIQRHLRAGDCYQINLTGFASVETTVHPWRAFADQARVNPVAFAAYARPDSRTVITSHSPERLLRLRGGRADSAPIKGTQAAVPNAIERLARSEKDLAEHVMIVDLERNDLGRHAELGSVQVASLFEALELNGLVHLVSRVEAMYGAAGRTWALADLFPGGSITGAPKRRAVEIIGSVERSRRGPYTGSVGFADRSGHSDWNIAIRTAVWQNGAVHFGCGGGIVLDSDADLEYEEAVLKARSFLASLRRITDLRAGQGAAP